MNDVAPNVRTRILDAAFQLVSEHGVADLTQPKVAAAAGVRTSHLTYYFPTRNDLLLEVARHCIHMLVEGMRQRLAHAPSKPSALTSFIAEAVTTIRAPRIMLSLIIASEEDRAIKLAFKELVANERMLMRELITAAGLPLTEEAITLCHTMAVGTAILNLARDDEDSRKEARAVARFIVEELIPRAGQRQRARSRKTSSPRRRG